MAGPPRLSSRPTGFSSDRLVANASLFAIHVARADHAGTLIGAWDGFFTSDRSSLLVSVPSLQHARWRLAPSCPLRASPFILPASNRTNALQSDDTRDRLR